MVVGPSGSGKSTLLRCINPWRRIDERRIWVDGMAGRRTTARASRRLRAEVGMVFQQFNLFPHMTVLENITLGPGRCAGVAAGRGA